MICNQHGVEKTKWVWIRGNKLTSRLARKARVEAFGADAHVTVMGEKKAYRVTRGDTTRIK